MAYKLKNITDKLSKRDAYFSKTLNIEYYDGFMFKELSLPAGQEMYVDFKNLPVSIRKMQIKGHLFVTTVSNEEFNKRKKEFDDITFRKTEFIPNVFVQELKQKDNSLSDFEKNVIKSKEKIQLTTKKTKKQENKEEETIEETKK